jgi:hypothetical protein
MLSYYKLGVYVYGLASRMAVGHAPFVGRASVLCRWVATLDSSPVAARASTGRYFHGGVVLVYPNTVKLIHAVLHGGSFE